MEHKFQKTIQDEYDHFFRLEGERAQRFGFIGYLRADYGRSGREFWTTWLDGQEILKTQEFKDEFDEIINYLREASLDPVEDGPDVFKFHCLQNMRRRVMDTAVRFKIVTANHSYYFRCQPQVDDYHLYVMCFHNCFLLPELERQRQLKHKPPPRWRSGPEAP